ncbi:hypothetical protein H0H87_011133 [Tephrocybe sp. NHM501043]|nr:hypothetical protein H0H87_011133 [Tephrocybe sp. NHM501043]
MTSESILLNHIVSQLKSNIDFLVQQNHLSRADANAFVAKLPSSSSVSSTPAPTPKNVRAVPPAPRNQPQQQQQAKALWGYNESGQEDDLSFHAGDIITITEETNADWWTGTVNGGKPALFPSAYVEKISSAPSPGISTAPFVSNSATTGTGKPYRPFGAAHHGRDVPPPPGAGVNSVGLQQEGGKEEKKNKFGKYGDTMAHSAAGGVGFGAGAAIGGGLVRAIF